MKEIYICDIGIHIIIHDKANKIWKQFKKVQLDKQIASLIYQDSFALK